MCVRKELQHNNLSIYIYIYSERERERERERGKVIERVIRVTKINIDE